MNHYLSLLGSWRRDGIDHAQALAANMDQFLTLIRNLENKITAYQEQINMEIDSHGSQPVSVSLIRKNLVDDLSSIDKNFAQIFSMTENDDVLNFATILAYEEGLV